MNIKIQYIVKLILLVLLALNCNNEQIVKGNTMDDSKQYKIKIVGQDTTLYATLQDTPTTRDFISLLPLDLELKDYAGTEKVSDLPKKLTTKNAPAGYDPSVGDITYYAPWGNLAIFYKDFGYASGLINLGKIEQGIQELSSKNSLNVSIMLVE